LITQVVKTHRQFGEGLNPVLFLDPGSSPG